MAPRRSWAGRPTHATVAGPPGHEALLSVAANDGTALAREIRLRRWSDRCLVESAQGQPRIARLVGVTLAGLGGLSTKRSQLLSC